MTIIGETVIKNIFHVWIKKFWHSFWHVTHSYFILFQQQKKRIGRKNQALCSLILSHLKERSVPDSATCREPPYPLGAKRLNYTILRTLESIASSFSPVHLSIFRIKLLTSESYVFPSTRQRCNGQMTLNSQAWGLVAAWSNWLHS